MGEDILVFIKDNGDIIQIYSDEAAEAVHARFDNDTNISFDLILDIISEYNSILSDLGINEHYKRYH